MPVSSPSRQTNVVAIGSVTCVPGSPSGRRCRSGPRRRRLWRHRHGQARVGDPVADERPVREGRPFRTRRDGLLCEEPGTPTTTTAICRTTAARRSSACAPPARRRARAGGSLRDGQYATVKRARRWRALSASSRIATAKSSSEMRLSPSASTTSSSTASRYEPVLPVSLKVRGGVTTVHASGVSAAPRNSSASACASASAL